MAWIKLKEWSYGLNAVGREVLINTEYVAEVSRWDHGDIVTSKVLFGNGQEREYAVSTEEFAALAATR
jgi:3-isopropylmalate dehydratase small subunit